MVVFFTPHVNQPTEYHTLCGYGIYKQHARVNVARSGIAAAAQIDLPYSPDGANAHPHAVACMVPRAHASLAAQIGSSVFAGFTHVTDTETLAKPRHAQKNTSHPALCVWQWGKLLLTSLLVHAVYSIRCTRVCHFVRTKTLELI